MIGQVLGHYRILAKIGEGGMGVVYRAHDEVLQRDVAVKVVGENAGVETQKFLLHEARASSALSHPNICTVYEIGDFNGELYIVMEFVEGKNLSALIAAGEGLPVQSVLRYGVQIAAGLAHAHSRGVVHRDLKSSNVVVTADGLAKILDFGLASRIASSHDEATRTVGPTEAQALTGTLAFMAPEILRGEPADQRSDIWALGVVLYEAASGKLPFEGRTSFELSSSILHSAPPPLPIHVPGALSAVVQRCLTKEPAQRYQLASEVHAALEALQSATVVAPQPVAEIKGLQLTQHRGIKHLQVKNGDVLLLVGTTKGAFLLRSSAQRTKWDVAGPYFHGHSIYAMTFDGRAGRRRIWASTQSLTFGTFLRTSDDFGKTWTNPQEAVIRFPPDSGASLTNIWQICLGREDEPDVLYCGVDPAALFESRDGGETWTLFRGLFEHPHRPRWWPSFGGLCLHTIVPDPSNRQRIYVAISAAGVYVTEDGGVTWNARNKGIRVVFLPEKYPEFGQCVHKIVLHPARPERLFLQNHWGLYRSDNHGESWQDIANGVPSDFGFAMLMHPHNPDCVYVIPVESDEFRCTPEGCLRVYRTRNAGESWEALTRGLPQKGAYENVLRDALTSDTLTPVGLYFGTRSGVLFGSTDEGKTWKRLQKGLPPITCVKGVVIGTPLSAKPAAKKGSKR